MGNGPVTIGRKVNFGFLEKEHFCIGSWIRNQGWEKLCSLDIPTYPRLVREFFKNLRIGIGSIESRVKDSLIIIDERRLGSLLEMTISRTCILNLKKKKDGLKVVLERNEVKDLGNLYVNKLLVEMKLLHNIVSQIFILKIGIFD